jgi:hypothetical protein
MEASIPVFATQAGVLVGNTVFTVVSKTGQATTFMLKHGTSLAALAVGVGVDACISPEAGLIARTAITQAGEAWITPAAESTSRSAAFAAGTVSGVATIILLTVAIVGGKAIIRKIQEKKAQTQQELPPYVEYTLRETEENFVEITAESGLLATVPVSSATNQTHAETDAGLELPLRSHRGSGDSMLH